MCVASCSTYWGYGGEQGPSLPGPVFHRRRLAVSNVTDVEKWPGGQGSERGEDDGVLVGGVVPEE